MEDYSIITPELIKKIKDEKVNVDIFEGIPRYETDIRSFVCENFNLKTMLNEHTVSVDRLLTDYRIILSYFLKRDELIKSIANATKSGYAIDSIKKFQYIKENDIEEYNKMQDNYSLDSVRKTVEEHVLEQNEEAKTYESRKVTLEKQILAILNNAYPEFGKITKKRYNGLDYCFFSFIWNTSDSPNYINFINKNYKDVDPYYIDILEYGILSLNAYHQSNLNPGVISKRFDLIRKDYFNNINTKIDIIKIDLDKIQSFPYELSLSCVKEVKRRLNEVKKLLEKCIKDNDPYA